MKKWSKERKKGFLSGLLVPTVALTVALCMGAGTMQSITAMVGGISIYVDGVLQEPKNANGEAVQPIAWQGTTYLPVRAVTGMLTDKEVSWDQQTSSVYIGKQPIAAVTPIDKLEAYTTNGVDIYVESKAEFQKLGDTVKPFNRLGIGDDCVYMLKSNYSELDGTLDISYSELGLKRATGVGFYSMDSYGEESLIDSYFCKAGDEPVDISIDLTGVEILKIKRLFGNDENWPYDTAVYGDSVYPQLYNVTLTAY